MTSTLELKGKKAWASFNGWLLLSDSDVDLESLDSDSDSLNSDLDSLHGNLESLDGGLESLDGGLETLDGGLESSDGDVESDAEETCFLRLKIWNPVTSDLVKLPPLRNAYKTIGICIFTSSPKDPDCKVLLFVSYNPVVMCCQLITQRWTIYDYGIDLINLFGEEYKGRTLKNVACLDGVIYALLESRRRQTIAIEFDSQHHLKLRSLGLEVPFWDQPALSFSEYFFASLGELYVVDVHWHHLDEIVGFAVHKLNFSEMVWAKVDNLNDHSFFLGTDCCSTSCLVTTVGVNQIHLPVDDDKHMYTYNMENGRVLLKLLFPGTCTPSSPSICLMPDICPDTPAEANHEIIRKEDKTLEHVNDESREIEENAHFPYHESDIFTSIAKHLYLEDYLHFRATCRLFHSAAPLYDWRTTCSTLKTQFSSPLLITFMRDKSSLSLLDPNHGNSFFINVHESLRGTSICCSKDGFLLLVKEGSIYFSNPFTRIHGRFPDTDECILHLSFSSKAPPSDFLVVRVDPSLDLVSISFIRSGEDEWHVEDFVTDFTPNYGPVLYDGFWYCIGQMGSLARFAIEEEGISWQVLDKPLAPCGGFHYTYLAECNGELISVFVGHLGKWVKVFRLDFSRMKWVRVRSLGNYMLFVSNPSSFSAVSRVSGMENKIYFPRFYGDEIVYYSLETRKFHSRGSNEVMDNFCNTSEQLYCGWIEPRGFKD